MSWTNNKDDKLKYLQQMGNWYLNEQCIGKEAHQIAGSEVHDPQNQDNSNENETLTKHCCLAEPLIRCYYRDKPSITPCPDSPFIDRKGKSFW